jgi:hypothetical protein
MRDVDISVSVAVVRCIAIITISVVAARIIIQRERRDFIIKPGEHVIVELLEIFIHG